MRRYLFRQLSREELLKREGHRFEGVIKDAQEQQVTNKWKYTPDENGKLVRAKEVVPVITFDDHDGLQLQWIPNRRCRQRLTDALGYDTNGWIGRRVAVFLREAARENKQSGRGENALERFVEVL
jgi:hypothetical protein